VACFASVRDEGGAPAHGLEAPLALYARLRGCQDPYIADKVRPKEQLIHIFLFFPPIALMQCWSVALSGMAGMWHRVSRYSGTQERDIRLVCRCVLITA
jgi:hypothetical protein